jgi:hypothetical protein
MAMLNVEMCRTQNSVLLGTCYEVVFGRRWVEGFDEACR